MPVDSAQFGQADLSKTEAHTEAPMTQLGRTTASNVSKTEGHTGAPIKQLGRAAASGSIIGHARVVQKESRLWFVLFVNHVLCRRPA